MSRRLYVHLSTTRGHGGSFQYELNALQAAIFLASTGVPVSVGYEDPEWDAAIPSSLEKFHVPRSSAVTSFFRLMMLARTPLFILRMLFRMLHPARHVMRRMAGAAMYFPSQDCQLSYLVDCDCVSVVHDLMHRYERAFPEAASTWRWQFRDTHFRSLCRASSAVCVDSLLGRQQVHESYGIAEDRIEVLPFAISGYIATETSPDFDQRYQLPKKFLFYPATLWLHKNHVCILRAMSLLNPQLPDIELVLVGGSGNAERSVMQLAVELGLEKRVRRFGYVPDEDITGFYKRARAMVMPSFFGPTNIPPLEAMYHGCPVLVANNYAMVEQCGDAAIGFDPGNPEELASAVARVWTDDELVRDLSHKGRARSAQLTQANFIQSCASVLGSRLGLRSSRS